jgi:hypothetical protein
MTTPAYAQLRDVKPPVDYPSVWPLFLGGAMLALAVAVAYVSVRRLRRLAGARQERVKSAWERSLEELACLEKEGLMAQRNADLYYSRLSGILRRYIEERFFIRAPEMTTEEFWQHLQRSSDLFPDQKQALKRFLESCDMVKFAKYSPDPSESKQSHELAVAFVKETTPRETAI